MRSHDSLFNCQRPWPRLSAGGPKLVASGPVVNQLSYRLDSRPGLPFARSTYLVILRDLVNPFFSFPSPLFRADLQEMCHQDARSSGHSRRRPPVRVEGLSMPSRSRRQLPSPSFFPPMRAAASIVRRPRRSQGQHPFLGADGLSMPNSSLRQHPRRRFFFSRPSGRRQALVFASSKQIWLSESNPREIPRPSCEGLAHTGGRAIHILRPSPGKPVRNLVRRTAVALPRPAGSFAPLPRNGRQGPLASCASVVSAKGVSKRFPPQRQPSLFPVRCFFRNPLSTMKNPPRKREGSRLDPGVRQSAPLRLQQGSKPGTEPTY